MATPEQQAEYDKFVKNGMRLIYGRKGVPKLVKSLDGNGDPVGGLANTLAAISMRLKSSAEQAGRPVPPDVLLHGGGELLEQLADFSAQSGGHAYSDEELRSIAKKMVGERPAPAAAPPASAAPAAPATPELMPARGGYGS